MGEMPDLEMNRLGQGPFLYLLGEAFG